MPSSVDKFVSSAEKTIRSDVSYNLVFNKGELSCDNLGSDKLEEIRALRESVICGCIKVRDGEYSKEDLILVEKWYKVMFSTPPLIQCIPDWTKDTKPPKNYNLDSIEKLNIEFSEQIPDTWLTEKFTKLASHITSNYHSQIKNSPERLQKWAEAGRRVLSKSVDIKPHKHTSKHYWTQTFYQNVSFPSEQLLDSTTGYFYTEFYNSFRAMEELGLLKPSIQAGCFQGIALIVEIEDVWLSSFISNNQIRQDLDSEEAEHFESILKKGLFSCLDEVHDLFMVSDYLNTILFSLDFGSSRMRKTVDGRLTVPLQYRIIKHDDHLFPLTAVYTSLVYAISSMSDGELKDRQGKVIDLFKKVYKDLPY